MRSKLLFLFLFFKKQDFKASLEQSIMLLRDKMNRLIILNEQYYSYSSHYSIAKNDVGEKGGRKRKNKSRQFSKGESRRNWGRHAAKKYNV